MSFETSSISWTIYPWNRVLLLAPCLSNVWIRMWHQLQSLVFESWCAWLDCRCLGSILRLCAWWASQSACGSLRSIWIRLSLLILEMLGDGCPVGPKITEEGNQLAIFLAGPGVSEGRVLGGLIGGWRVGILFPRALVGEWVMLGKLVGPPGWKMLWVRGV